MARRKLRHRIPVRLRHYWRLIAGSVGVVSALALVLGTVRVSALDASEPNPGFAVNWGIEGTQDLFDTSEAHEISLEYDEDYQEMVETFQDSGEKEWIKADITIDWTVGIRLKGNSTRSSLGGGGAGGFGGGQRELPEDMEPPEGMEDTQVPEGMGEGGIGGGGGVGGASLSFDEPEGLPWLVDFSKFVDGQVYQVHQRISFRVDSGMGGGPTLAEAGSLGGYFDELNPPIAKQVRIANATPRRPLRRGHGR